MEAPKPQPRFPLKTTVFVILLSSCILAIPIAQSIWGAVAAHRLKQTLAKLHDQGEPLNGSELMLDSIPDADNASLNYRAASESIDATKTRMGKVLYDADSSEFQLPLNATEQATINAILTDNKPAILLVDEARGKSFGGWNDDFDQLKFPVEMQLNGVRNLCNLLKLHAMQNHARHDDDLAADRLMDALLESDAAEHRPTLVGHLVAIGTSTLAARTISTMSPELRIGINHLTRDQLKLLLNRLCDEGQLAYGEKLGWRSERIINLQFLHTVETGEIAAGPDPNDLQQKSKATQLGSIVRPIILGDENLLALDLQATMLAADAPSWPAAQPLISHSLAKLADAHPIYHIAVRMLALSYDKAIMADYRAKAERRLAAAAIAVRLYAADHNNALPTSLGDLVPAYLAAIPIDPMSGKPMIFKPDPPRIYSVGDDGIDDNGIPLDTDSSNPFYRHHGDIVAYLIPQPRKPIHHD